MFASVVHGTHTSLQLYTVGHSIQSTFRIGHKPQFTSYLHFFMWINHLKLKGLSFPNFKVSIKYPNHQIIQKIM